MDFQPEESERDVRRVSRRTLLAGATGGALLALVPQSLRNGLSLPSANAAGPKRFATKLPIPRVLRGAHLRIPIREAHVQVLPGPKTRMWTYDGTFPGPTIRRPSGHATRVTFVHDLPRSAGELTVHLHGGHTSSRDDGQPGGLTQSHPKSLYCDISPGLSERASGNGLLIKPGKSRAYHYPLMEDGEPERAAFQWYHDHRLDHTSRNVWRGLAGMMILDDEFDDALPLPQGERDIPLMIVDRSFDRSNQLTNPFRGGGHPPNDGLTGEYVLVNGAYAPHHHVDARRHRLRVLNASQFRSYRLQLSDGVPMTQIATESGLMPAPVERGGILIGPAERVELIADFGAAPRTNVVLRSVHRGPQQPTGSGSKPFEGPLMQFRVGRRKPDHTQIPASLRPLPAWTASASPSPDRTWVFGINGFTWTINGQTFDPSRSDAFPVLGTTETWQITNGTGIAHLAHIHATDWYMLSRNGHRPPPWEDCLKETFFLDPGESVIVAGHFTDHLGKFVIHCHMLDHEDHGLMTQYEVVDSKAKQPAGDEVAARRRAGVAKADAAPSLGLPAAADGGTLAFTPKAPSGERLRRLELLIDGRMTRTIKGMALQHPIRLSVPGDRPFLVTAVGRTQTGRYVSAVREYAP
jgi:FtsP/CotA-like multicopper oxidase with cupredoxin domain